MSKEQDNYIIKKLYNKMMPLCVANLISDCEQEIQDRIEENREYRRTHPYKQKRNKDRDITAKRKALKMQKRKCRR